MKQAIEGIYRNGIIELLEVPEDIQEGQKIVVLVMEPLQDNINDLVAASTSSLAFWDNEIDDAEWNHT